MSRACLKRNFMQNLDFLQTHLNPNYESHQEQPQKHERRRGHETELVHPQIQVDLNREPQERDDVPLQPRESEHPPTQVELHQEPQRQDVSLQARESEHLPTQVELHRELQKPDVVVPLQPRDQAASHQELQQPLGRSGFDKPEQLQRFIAHAKKIIKRRHSSSRQTPKAPLQRPPGEETTAEGFDELKDNTNVAVAPPRPRSIEEKMPLQILYQWLVTGKLLEHASIVTTTRPGRPCKQCTFCGVFHEANEKERAPLEKCWLLAECLLAA
ncbi:hypothetical protein AWC38_SpisGene7976 [Stylophora pistillata]|uniref:Uncharacterized protein n=1 Tax=Stylophora pistillata TaxID=50429 RepID=A0A2B4SFL3_STYPI|nr:hypothetical protein AWC38_SpisGene7976 [Stylophora pistillata]